MVHIPLSLLLLSLFLLKFSSSIKQDMRLHVNIGDTSLTKGSLVPFSSTKFDTGDCEDFYQSSSSFTLATFTSQLKPPLLNYGYVIIKANFVDFIHNAQSSAVFTLEVTDGTFSSIFKQEDFFQFDQNASALSFGAVSNKTIRRNYIGIFSVKVNSYNPDKLVVNVEIVNGQSKFYVQALQVFYSTCDLLCDECEDTTRLCTSCVPDAEDNNAQCSCLNSHHIKVSYDKQQSTKLECMDKGNNDPCLSYEQKGNMSICSKCKEGFVLSNLSFLWEEQSNFPIPCKCPPLYTLIEGKCEKISYTDCKAETLWQPKSVAEYIDKYENQFRVNVQLQIEPITNQHYYAQTFYFPSTESVDKRLMSFALVYDVKSNERRINIYSYGEWASPEGLFFNKIDIKDISACSYTVDSNGLTITSCSSLIYIFNTCTTGIYAKGNHTFKINENTFVAVSFDFQMQNRLI